MRGRRKYITLGRKYIKKKYPNQENKTNKGLEELTLFKGSE